MATPPRRQLTPEQKADAARLNDIYQRTKAALANGPKPLRLTQQKVADDFGWSNQSAFNQYTSGRIPLNLKVLIGFARYFDCDPADISPTLAAQLGTAERPTIAEPAADYRAVRLGVAKVPVISEDQAEKWNTIYSGFSPKDAERWLEVTKHVGPRAFARIVVGDSMTNPQGSPSFPEGMIIVVDPDVAPAHRSFVMAKVPGISGPLFRQLVIEAGTRHLKPLNPQFKIIVDDGGCEIIGVAVQAVMDLLP